MSVPFAALEERLTKAVFSRLANVETTLAGVVVRGIFDNAYALADVGGAGMASTQPTLTLPTAQIPPVVIDWFRHYAEPFDLADLQLQIAGGTYKAVAHEPDGAGVSLLLLERVA